MPTKLFTYVVPGTPAVDPADGFQELGKLSLEEGLPYLARATGLADLFGGAEATLKLEVRGPSGEVISSSPEPTYINDRQQFVLTAATPPAEGSGGSPPPPAVSANLLADVNVPASGGTVFFFDLVLTALAVDEVVTA
jgi:hypothetical protein